MLLRSPSCDFFLYRHFVTLFRLPAFPPFISLRPILSDYSNMSWVHNGRPVPPTQTYDLDDISEWRTILAVSIVLTALMAAVVALRAYTRGQVVHALGADDWVTFISAVRRPLRIKSSCNTDPI